MRSTLDQKARRRKVSVVIEHLEPVLGEWIWLEYRHVSKMVGQENILFANVKNRSEATKLAEIGRVTSNSVIDLKNITNTLAFVLDPQASQQLSPTDFTDNTSLIVGGILGDYPARGRTKKEITTKMKSESRNLGATQFSVDGAVCMALQVASGLEIREIPVKVGMELSLGKHLVNVLPFAYPIIGRKPLLTPGLRQYLRRGIVKDEEILFRTGRPRSIV
jgi:ribosome biogenesis SPOUT family RNA methylase Rps3